MAGPSIQRYNKTGNLERQGQLSGDGVNIWKHAHSLAPVQSAHSDYYLGKPKLPTAAYALLQKPDVKQHSLPLTVDMTKRDDVNAQKSLPRISKILARL